MKQSELNRITDLIKEENFSMAIWTILLSDMNETERISVHKELVTELQCNGYLVYKPENIIAEGQINNLIQSLLPDYEKCNPPLNF